VTNVQAGFTGSLAHIGNHCFIGLKGDAFFSFHRNIGSASAAERGNSSKCCTKNANDGIRKDQGNVFITARKRSHTLATAALTAALFTMLVSTADGIRASAGSDSTAYPSSEPVRLQRAAATRSEATSMAKEMCGRASSQRAMLRAHWNW